MNTGGILMRKQELEQRQLGMRSLDPAKIAWHFGRAAELRALIDKASVRLVHGACGTKGACPPHAH